MSRIPVRIRVTLAFAAVMAVLIAAAGLFLYLRLESQLNESIDDGLRSRASDLTTLAQQQPGALAAGGEDGLIEPDESLAQVLTRDGRVVDSTPQLEDSAVLSEAALQDVGPEGTFSDTSGIPEIEEGGEVRLLAAPVGGGTGNLVAVVGASLEDRNEALGTLLRILLIGGPVALLLASLAGYGAASFALRPVESMRRRAATISAGGPDARLPVPPAGDELTRLGETLNAMLARLDAGLERERQFTDDAAHELRTPLALHKSELELALRYGRSEAELRESIGSAIEEVDRLVQLAEDLLVVARSEQGKLALALERLRAADVFEGVKDRFGARAAQAGRAVRVDGGGDLALEGDRLRLQQALTNMVDNAFRHGAGDVHLWARANGNGVELHVTDAGEGFPPAFLAHAFERFSRADEARERGGTGLGLAIVDTIARAHGGSAGAHNVAAGGADVWIEIPDE